MKRLLALLFVAVATTAVADGLPNGPRPQPPPPPVANCPPPPVKGLVLTPRGWTATPYVYTGGGLPPVRRGPNGEVGYPYQLQPVVQGPCGYPFAYTYPPAQEWYPNIAIAPPLPLLPGFFFFGQGGW